MAKPILSPIGIFDSVVGTTVYFNIYTTSNQVSDYIYSVYDSQSNSLLFSGNGTSNDLNYSVANGYSFAFSPNAALTNRAENYYLQLKVKLQGDTDYGEESAATTFYCKDKPVLLFANIRQDRENIVELSSGIFTMSYAYIEAQGETLKNYQYKFYDSNKSEIESSSIFYGAMSHSYSVTGLQNNQTYYIRGFGETKNGFNLDTGFYTIKTSFSSVNNGYALEATNDYKKGLIKVTSHFISSDGEAEGAVAYIPSGNNDYSLDLTGGGTVTYSIPDSISVTNFNLKFIVKPDYSLTFANLKWAEETHNISARVLTNIRSFTDVGDDSSKVYAVFILYLDGDVYSVLNSNYLSYELNSEKYIYVELLCTNGIFDLSVREVS